MSEAVESAPASGSRSWATFVRLWIVLVLSYFTVKFVFNVTYLGWVDLRPDALVEAIVVPLGQSAAYWMITRRRYTR